MKNFIVLYHAPMDAMKQTADTSTEEQAKGMELWMQWAQKCGDQLIDLGAPLMNGQQLKVDGSSKNSSREVVGYSILKAENIDEAKKLLAGHPHLGWDASCSIEVHETMPMPGM